MRYISFILLTSLTFMVLGPGSLFTIVTCGESDAMLSELDVCHSSSHPLSSGSDTPCMHGCPCQATPPRLFSVVKPPYPVFAELILASNKEHPPNTLR